MNRTMLGAIATLIFAAELTSAVALARPAETTIPGAAEIYRRISTDVTCAGDGCLPLIGWRGQVAKWCNRFRTPAAAADPAAAASCSTAQFGLMSAVIKANSYGWGTFTDRTDPAWFEWEWGCSTPAADGHMHRPETDDCPFVPGRGW
jgi:hypothetical protein